MAATKSPVVSPRKGKHARSGGLTFSQPAASRSDAAASTSFSSFSTPAATAAFPAGFDPLTLDADEAFIRFSVREVQSMEANLQSSHDQLSSKLKGLVSDRYRDMLGTANTLIEMSTSATNLVKRLDSVRQGVTSVKDANGGGIEDGLDDKNVSPSGVETVISQGETLDDKDKTNVLAIAAATKLLAEAPDELWRAIESASYSSKTSKVSGKQRGVLTWREWTDFKAASALKAAWIYILCERAWNWLSVEVEATSLFPYVSKQWHSMVSLKAEITRVSQAGLAGWFTSSEKSGVTRWEDMSSTYISTATFALTEALLNKQSLISSRDALLSERRKAIEEHLTKTANSATTTIARTIRCIADTIIHCLQAFYLNETQSKGLSLVNLFESVASPLEAFGTFPPHARQVLVSLPTGEVLVEHLPVDVKLYAPALSCEDAQQCHDTTMSTLRVWCEELRVAGRENFFKSSVERLDTISAVGEAQIQIRRAVDRSISLLQKAVNDVEARHSMEEEIRLFAEILEGALLERVDVLCRQRTAELSLAVCESTTSALRNLNKEVHQSSTGTTKTYKEQEMERTPIKFVFQSDVNVPDVKGKLRLQTPLVKQVLASVEEKAKTLATEIESYSAFVENDALRRKKRKQRRDEQVDRQSHDSSTIEEQVGKVLDSYRTAFDGARLALVDELRRQLGLQAHLSGDQRAVQHLLIARIASSLQRSTVLRSATTVAAKSNDAVFQQGLADLRAQVLSGWVSQMVEEAIAGYAASIEESVEPAGDNDHGRPTPCLAEALLKLVDGIDATGCGHQSEASALGRQVLSAFVAAWVQIDAPQQEKRRDCFMSDSLILLTLVREYGEEAEKEADQLAHLVGDALASQSHPAIETGIQRLRLILHPLRCPQITRVADRKTPSEAAPPPCPPLPMVKLVSAREKIALF